LDRLRVRLNVLDYHPLHRMAKSLTRRAARLVGNFAIRCSCIYSPADFWSHIGFALIRRRTGSDASYAITIGVQTRLYFSNFNKVSELGQAYTDPT